MTSTGEAVLFWILGPLAVVGALGLVFARKAVHAAIGVAMTMIILGVFYIAQDAAFLGVMPFGALTAGTLADLIGPRATLTLGGLCCVTAALFLARNRHRLREQIRPIYEKLGIARR